MNCKLLPVKKKMHTVFKTLMSSNIKPTKPEISMSISVIRLRDIFLAGKVSKTNEKAFV